MMNPRSQRAFSMVGMLVTMACIVVLFTILMNSLNTAMTGQGSQLKGTVRSFEDQMNLTALFQSMAAHASDYNGSYLVPSRVSGTDDESQDTTANLFSAMVMQRHISPKQLISGNEYSGYVEECFDYNYLIYNPGNEVFWDPEFQADLNYLSHVSFAHMPLFGERFEKYWKDTMTSRFPLIGNRGPKDGVHDPNSWTYGRDGQWRGHIVFGDGHIDFVDNFTPNGIYFEDRGERVADNIFFMDTGPHGDDAILSFTKSMTHNGPELQFD